MYELTKLQRKQHNRFLTIWNFSKTKSLCIEKLLKDIKLVVTDKQNLYLVMREKSSNLNSNLSKLLLKEQNKTLLCRILQHKRGPFDWDIAVRNDPYSDGEKSDWLWSWFKIIGIFGTFGLSEFHVQGKNEQFLQYSKKTSETKVETLPEKIKSVLMKGHDFENGEIWKVISLCDFWNNPNFDARTNEYKLNWMLIF